jgi:hypothetical protein
MRLWTVESGFESLLPSQSPRESDGPGAAGARHDAPARAPGPRRSDTRPRGDPRPGRGVRRLPHRRARHRGRPPGAAAPARARAPSGRARRRERPRRIPIPARRSRRDRLAPRDLRVVRVLPRRPREPLRLLALHGLGRPRRIRRGGDHPRKLRLPDSRFVFGRRGRTAPVRRPSARREPAGRLPALKSMST